MTPRYIRGDKHPSSAELFFLRYTKGREVWVNRQRLDRVKRQAIAINARQRRKPQYKERMKNYLRSYMRRPEQKARLSSYYKQAHVRERYNQIHNAKPEVIARREARLAWRKERAEYRTSDDFKAVLKERNARNYANRKALGKSREYDRNRWQKNLQYRLGQNMRRMVAFALTRTMGALKAARTFDLIGCSVSALRLHLESQFNETMTWENYGSTWHVDHRLPLSLFDLTDPNQQRIAFHFENLRPLLATENFRKSDRVIVDGKEVRARHIGKIIPFKAA